MCPQKPNPRFTFRLREPRVTSGAGRDYRSLCNGETKWPPSCRSSQHLYNEIDTSIPRGPHSSDSDKSWWNIILNTDLTTVWLSYWRSSQQYAMYWEGSAWWMWPIKWKNIIFAISWKWKYKEVIFQPWRGCGPGWSCIVLQVELVFLVTKAIMIRLGICYLVLQMITLTTTLKL